MTNQNNTLELKILPRVVLRAPRPNDSIDLVTCGSAYVVVLVTGNKCYKLDCHTVTKPLLVSILSVMYHF